MVRFWRVMPLAALSSCAGCQTNTAINLDDPKLATFIRLVMPAKVEIQRYLTRPVDIDSKGKAEGLEVILAVFDSFGDPVKCAGTFHFELHQRRMASADTLGKLVARWSATIDSERTLVEYWDRYSRYYRFPLTFADKPLPPGHYVLDVTLVTPTGEKLFDQYDLAHGGPQTRAVDSPVAPAGVPDGSE